MRPQQTDAAALAAVLDALGAEIPLHKREWVAEKDLIAAAGDRKAFAAVTLMLARAAEVTVHLRSGPRGRRWLLERAGRRPREDAQPASSPAPKRVAPLTLLPSPLRPSAAVPRESTSPVSFLPRENAPAPVPSGLADALAAIGVRVQEIAPDPLVGPAFIRHKVILQPGERIEALRRRSEDIGRELGCRVLISQVPGDRHVAIDVPRAVRDLVPLLPAISSLPTIDGLWIPVGVSPSGQTVFLDLSTLPHLLLAGASGAGKTMLMVTALLALVMRLGPEQLELVIIDPKGLDFPRFADLPHCRGKRVVTDPEEAIAVLAELTGQELRARTQLLQEHGCVNFQELRRRHPGAAKFVVVAIDEFADLVSVLPRAEREAFEKSVLRLAQRARAIGVHVVIATQRPTTEFITGAVKANLPTRISFRLPQRIDSMTILDQPGAENLLGVGDMLLLHEGQLQRLQGYFASTDEIARLIAERRDQLEEP